MGLTKQYLRYAHSGTFNLISSTQCNVCFVVLNGQEGRYLAVGAAENVYLWDLRLNEKALVVPGESHREVSRLGASPDRVHLAVGYTDGSVALINLISGEQKTVFCGHKYAISSFAFDQKGHRLASGSKDTEIVTWDIIAEVGLERLSGHKGVVTSLVFMNSRDILISSSKDSFIKFWDLETSHCFHTIASHITEVWDIRLLGSDQFLVSGSNDSELRVWSISSSKSDETVETGDVSFFGGIKLKKCGSILRSGRGRVVSMTTDNTNSLLSVHGQDVVVETFKFLPDEEASLRAKKRIARSRKKALKTGETVEINCDVCLIDRVKRLGCVKASYKIKSIGIVCGKSEIRVATSLSNNKLELYSLEEESNEANCLRHVELHGHQGEVRAVAVSSDALAIASVGSSSVKIWNRASLACLRTVPSGYAVSVCFVPGDRHVLVGMKDGSLCIVDLSSSTILETIPAHKSELWSVVLTPDSNGAVTCGGDSTVKVWKFELVNVEDSEVSSKVLSVSHTRTLKLEDSVLCVRLSPDSKYIAACLLDSTTKIFFFDTFKFFLSLYGHSMPVLCCDISSDSTLIVTGSADRNIKIWGLDFGDCHKSLFAHDDSVTSVAFVPGTHYFFSCGKDGKIKEWDADTFNKIVTLEGHFGECWGLGVSKDHLVSCGQDRTLRLYSKTNEPLVLSDEQETEREQEEELATGQETDSKLPSTRTVSAERAADLLFEYVDVVKKYLEEESSGVKPLLPPIMKALNVHTPAQYLGKTLTLIRPSELGEALYLLPYDNARLILEQLPPLFKNPLMIELAIKTMVHLIKMNHSVISTDPSAVMLIDKLKAASSSALHSFRDMVGSNLIGLTFVKEDIEEKEGVKLFKEAMVKKKDLDKKRKRKEAAKRTAIMSI